MFHIPIQTKSVRIFHIKKNYITMQNRFQARRWTHYLVTPVAIVGHLLSKAPTIFLSFLRDTKPGIVHSALYIGPHEKAKYVFFVRRVPKSAGNWHPYSGYNTVLHCRRSWGGLARFEGTYGFSLYVLGEKRESHSANYFF